LSSIAWAEFLCGPLAREHAELAAAILGETVPFGSEEAALTADLYNAGGRRRGSLGDCMIAACAIRRDAELATSNATDFERLVCSGLRLAVTRDSK
jgi:predicted nucleic acid-binding protein